MEIEKSVTYILKFKVEFFESLEGGMDFDQYGEDVSTLEEALHLFELAKIANPGYDWKITCTPKINIKGEKNV